MVAQTQKLIIMYYLVKVFTPEFKVKVDNFIAKKLEGLEGFDKTWKEMNERGYLNTYWNGRMKLVGESKHFKNDEEFQAALLEEYGDIAVPQFDEIHVPKAEVGLQSRARIMWNGEIQKIDEIDEIFSYKTVDKLPELKSA